MILMGAQTSTPKGPKQPEEPEEQMHKQCRRQMHKPAIMRRKTGKNTRAPMRALTKGMQTLFLDLRDLSSPTQRGRQLLGEWLTAFLPTFILGKNACWGLVTISVEEKMRGIKGRKIDMASIEVTPRL